MISGTTEVRQEDHSSRPAQEFRRSYLKIKNKKGWGYSSGKVLLASVPVPKGEERKANSLDVKKLLVA